MKALLIAAALAAGAAFAPARATILDFAAEADANGERGLAFGSSLTLNGVNMLLFGDDGDGEAFPYLDAGAGLGVCKALDADDQCVPAEDGAVGAREVLILTFANSDFTDFMPRTITSLVFRDADHNLIDATNDGLVRIVTNNGDVTDLFSSFIAMAEAGHAFFKDVTSILFFGDFADREFYLSALEVSDIPIPGALPLLFSGLAGLGFASRRRRQA